MTYKLCDLEWRSSRLYRQEPTGSFTTNRNGRKVPITKGTEYVKTAAAGTMPLSEWYRRAETAVKNEGKDGLLKRIEDHCKRHIAWLHSDQEFHEYALECLSSKAYKAWDGFSNDEIEVADK